MKDCPPDAIHRSVNGEVFIDDSCIGCGNCQNNCPYGVIQMTNMSTYKRLTIRDVIFGRRKHPEVNEEIKRYSPRKAVKCDMCKDIIGGPACVRACPTGAALRVSPEDFLGFVK